MLVLVKLMPISLPKRDELLFRRVFAFPKASRMGFVCRTASSTPPPPACTARNCIANLVVSVFPAPDSPLTMMLWFLPLVTMSLNAARANW